VVLGHSRIECPNFPSPCIANGDIKSFPSRTHCFTLSLPTANSIIGLKHSYCYETTLKNNLSLHKDKILVCPCARTQISAWIYEYILFFSFPFETTYLFRFFTPCTINWDRKSFVSCLSEHIRQHIIHSGGDWCIYRREIEKIREAFCHWGLKCDRIVTQSQATH
jgi:hypothetical protein